MSRWHHELVSTQSVYEVTQLRALFQQCHVTKAFRCPLRFTAFVSYNYSFDSEWDLTQHQMQFVRKTQDDRKTA
jgi:hypothetical protein